MHRQSGLGALAAIVVGAGTAFAQPLQTPPRTDVYVDVIGATPLPGIELRLDDIPSPVQSATDQDILKSHALDLADFLNRRMNGVYVNDVQGNPFQPDISYRGYTASPLLGTPQGLSVFLDSVRINQPFGEVVSWDLIPRLAISSTVLMPGSNPLFGLNTLGGALAIQTKSGRTNPGTTAQVIIGSDFRRAVEFESGGENPGLDWYLTGNLFAEDGWRDHTFKAYADVDLTSRLTLELNVVTVSSSFARGNENNLHEPDGTCYLGTGTSPGYGIVNLGAQYRVVRWLEVVGQLNNLFDTHYYTAAQLGPSAFTAQGSFIARPLPAVNGEFPIQHTTFFTPGAPRLFWLGTRFRF